jgi:glycosyltransferase involved in cell wall biosynthesis
VRIAVDGGTWTNARGYGRFTREILSAAAALESRHAFTLVVDDTTDMSAIPPGLSCVGVHLGTPPSRAAAASGRRSIRDLRAMSRALAAQHASCVFFPSVYTYVPILTRAPLVVCIHDVIPERFPDHVFPTRRARLFWTLKTRAAVRQAARVVTVSSHARTEIAAQFGLDEARIAVLSEAASAAFGPHADPELGRTVLRTFGLAGDARFVLYVGGLAPHKNIEALMDAVLALRADPRFAGLALVIVGDYTDDVFHSVYPDLRRRAGRADEGAVVFTGALPDSAVAGLMRLTQAVVLPSLDEGFGLPALEGAACGAAVIATRESAMPEVLGDAARYIEPADTDGLRRTIAEILANDGLRTALGNAAAARARACTWTAAAERLLRVFDEVEGATGPRVAER